MGEGRSLRELGSESKGERSGVSLKNSENAEKFGKMDYSKVGDGSLKDMPVKKNSISEISNNAGDGALNKIDFKPGDSRNFYKDLGKKTDQQKT
jgi:hypothetical protein